MKTFAFFLGMLCLCAGGCGNMNGWEGWGNRDGMKGWDMMAAWRAREASNGAVPAGYVKPTIAVAKFNNNSTTPANWNVGDGLKDVLTDRLVASGRFRVVERPDLTSVTEEMRVQQSGLTRPQQRAASGRVKNAQYLVKGTVVDFGHVSTTAAWYDWRDRMSAGGMSHRAVVSVSLQVVDVESGEVICSEFMEESVRANAAEAKVGGKEMTLGGRGFWQKPLGEAMTKVVGKAVKRVAVSVAAQPWSPRVAGVENGQVVINGGRDRRMRAGMRFDVYQQGGAIVDPDTGDVIGTHPGKPVGRVEVSAVYGRFSTAALVQGQAEAIEYGQRCAKPGMPLPVAALPGVKGPITPTPTLEKKK